ncbi:unnamed protein product [Calypogeia fissa]
MGVQNSKGKEKGAMLVNALNLRCVNHIAIHQNMVNGSSGIQSSILNGTTMSPLGGSNENDARVVGDGPMNQKKRF